MLITPERSENIPPSAASTKGVANLIVDHSSAIVKMSFIVWTMSLPEDFASDFGLRISWSSRLLAPPHHKKALVPKHKIRIPNSEFRNGCLRFDSSSLDLRALEQTKPANRTAEERFSSHEKNDDALENLDDIFRDVF